MSLECSKCGYPATQTLACPECGGGEFRSPGDRGRKRWWRALAAVIAFQVLHAAGDVGKGVAIARWTSTGRSATPAGFSECIASYLRTSGIEGFGALGAAVLGTALLVAAAAAPERRGAYLIAAAVLCAAYAAASIFASLRWIALIM